MIITPEEIVKAEMRLAKNRHRCGKHIIILEGPAGVGKTSLLQRLESLNEVGIVQRSLEKRELGKYEAGAKSFLNDNIKIMNALLAKESVVVIDRCIASQVVYHGIRTGQKVRTTDPLIKYAKVLMDELEEDLAWRLDRYPRRLHLYWMFLIPSVEVLEERRKTGGKEYPHQAELEIRNYKDVFNHLIFDRREVLKPRYENQGDQDFIVAAFKKWMTHFPHLTFSGLWRSFATLSREEITGG